MNLKFQYTKEEYANAFWINCTKMFQPKRDALIGIICIFCVGWAIYDGETFLGGLLLGLIALFITIVLAARFVYPQWIYKEYIRDRGEISFDISDEGIYCKASNIESKLNWSLYKYVLINSEHYFLYSGKNQFTIFPKRIFESLDQLKEFDLLIRKHILDVKTI